MAEIPFLIKDLALILMVAGIVTLIFKRLKQPLVLGYIMAGFLVSPHMPYTMSVVDETDIQTWADIGVIFTLFSLGLDFSFKKIVKMGASPIIATVVIVFCMMMLGISVGHGFGWGRMDCIFLGGMLAMSSTTIIYKAFDDMRLRTQKFASMVMSVLILEDILAIVMMIPFLGLTDFNTKGEPREAVVAYTMLEHGNWILPINNGGDIPYKPPFFHWCIAFFSLFIGHVNEYTSRLPSAVSLVLMTIGGFVFYAKRKNAPTSLIAAILTLTAFEVHRAGMNCRVDMVNTALWWEPCICSTAGGRKESTSCLGSLSSA